MDEFFVETQFSQAIYESEEFEVLEGGVLHLFNERENGKETVVMFAPPYDMSMNPSS